MYQSNLNRVEPYPNSFLHTTDGILPVDNKGYIQPGLTLNLFLSVAATIGYNCSLLPFFPVFLSFASISAWSSSAKIMHTLATIALAVVQGDQAGFKSKNILYLNFLYKIK